MYKLSVKPSTIKRSIFFVKGDPFQGPGLLLCHVMPGEAGPPERPTGSLGGFDKDFRICPTKGEPGVGQGEVLCQRFLSLEGRDRW